VVELTRACLQHLDSASHRPLLKLAQQCRLADPGRTLQDHDPALVATHAVDEAVDQSQLGIPLKEHRAAP
jgi:hypothetical protein